MTHRINKILIANRGEIAVRVMRTCREMGIATVAVYSEADRSAPHVMMADEAWCIGAPPARESYLRGDVIIQTALEARADAVHPGYGFLAENADFAQAVSDAGLLFIGPPASAIQAMGSKTEARHLLAEAGVPVVPGDRKGLDSVEAAMASAKRIGFPVLIKAARGGGGKGMRIVRAEDELPSAFEGARRESLSAFGSDEVYLEKYIEGPRHIEVQVLADQHGKVIHLFERECSIQRRHQKVIEEAPSPALRELRDVRESMGAAAVAAARACGYVNAGTVEFLFDPSTSSFYFLEMNTRLQVEHPVTELVTGIDLVREQILIAQGERLRLDPMKVSHRGHAIECRIYAEDPESSFLPDAGTITRLVRPDGPWVRVDSGTENGSKIGVYYDPLIAKLIVWGPDRESAIRRMRRALFEYVVAGLKTTLPFERWVMENPRYISGDFDTRFIEREYRGASDLRPDESVRKAALIAAALVKREADARAAPPPAVLSENGSVNAWKRAGKMEVMR